MKDKSRRKFLLDIGKLTKTLFKALVIFIFAYVSLMLLIGTSNITIEGWKYISTLAAFILLIYMINIVIERLKSAYINATGDKGRANVNALNRASEAIYFSFCGAMVMRAYFEQREDNIAMWCGIILFSIFSMFKREIEPS